MLKPGDVVLAKLIGAVSAKYRPAVVISTDLYNSTRSDVLVALLTTQLAEARMPTDYVLQDWGLAKLRAPTAFRLFVDTMEAAKSRLIGHLSDRDWAEIQARLRLGIAVS
jgi:mRNA-degrading endonuclease toxin of MazEF toxin-antitoxin module